MDIMNMTIAQILEKANELYPQVMSELSELEAKVKVANKVREDAGETFYAVECDETAKALDDAEDNYWKLDDLRDQKEQESRNLTSLAHYFSYLHKCENIHQVAEVLGL